MQHNTRLRVEAWLERRNEGASTQFPVPDKTLEQPLRIARTFQHLKTTALNCPVKTSFAFRKNTRFLIPRPAAGSLSESATCSTGETAGGEARDH